MNYCLLTGSLHVGLPTPTIPDYPRSSAVFIGWRMYAHWFADLLHSERTCCGVSLASMHSLHRGLSVVVYCQDTHDLPEIVPFQPNVMSCKQTMKLMLWLIITCTFSSRTYPETPRIKTVSIRLIATTCRLKVVICTTRWQTSRCSTHAPGSTTSCSLSVNFFLILY